MGGLSWWHWLIIGAAFILLFGAKKLPDTARGIGRSLRILKSEVSAMNDESNAATAIEDELPEEISVAKMVAPAPIARPDLRVSN